MTNATELFSQTTFDQLDLPQQLHEAVAELGFERLTQVQDRVLPLSLAGRDVVVQAHTGSGKTAAYLLTIFSHLLRLPRPSPPETPRALVVAPTRELAVQIAGDADALARHLPFAIHVVFGGLDYRKQRSALEAGTDVVIGTPGRLIDYHRQGSYSLRQTELVVIDECDRLFDMGFADDLRWIMRQLPHPKSRQSMMFTATLSQRVMTLGFREMNNPEEVIVSPGKLTPETITQVLYHVSSREKLSLLLGLLEREASTRTMVFVNTRFEARRLVDQLDRHGFVARGLTGNVVQSRRLKALDDFRDGRLPILVATDVASRGLHIEGVSHVVNYDLPQDPEDYVHRIGRTARVGAEGKAITLACEEYVYSLDAVQRFVGYEIPVAFASDDLFAEVLPRGERRRRSRAPAMPKTAPPEPAGAEPATPSPTAARVSAPPATEGAGTAPAPRRKRRRRRRAKRPDAAPPEGQTPAGNQSGPENG